ncbi:MAG: hypothetical protein KDC18_04445 [Alphaproteobacteria bacterium]|nr:hypothetical protein [Alphaproteobacteria bacterium]MCB9930119.1 hypothetical protein [Alphaproteobacteria bacterium]
MPALATNIDLQNAQIGNADILHLWSFEGASNATRHQDSAGSADLHAVAGEGNVGGVPGNVADIGYEAGFNGGQAYRPSYVDPAQSSTAGAALVSNTGLFTSPNRFTIEAVVRADQKTTGSAVNYIFQTRPNADRGYFLVQDEAVGASQIGSIIGNNFSDGATADTYLGDGVWLYVAAAIDLVTTPGQASADIYFANLSTGDTLLTQVANDRTWNTANPSTLAGTPGIFGIGAFAIDRNGDDIAEAAQEFFQGAIDSVAIYDTLLDGTALQGNLTALLEPAAPPVSEAAPLALLATGGLALAGLARRRQRQDPI